MALNIYWTRCASVKFDSIIEYLEQNWGEQSTRKFVGEVYALLDLLSIYPEVGPLQHEGRNIRGIVIVKQVTLFYKIENKNIVLLNFFGNPQHPKKKF